MGEENEATNTQQSTTESEALNFLDSVDNYLILIESLTSTLGQGWLELSSARHSMGGSRLNNVLLTLKHHSAPTTVELDYDNAGSMTKSKAPQLTLSKWKPSATQESNESEATTSPLKTENHRGKVLSMFGGMVSPKLRASQLSFETALETLVEIANVRSSVLEAHRALKLHKG
ncbi:hypothetical protein LXL04_024182 [Taraxacum kok-saghyz]